MAGIAFFDFKLKTTRGQLSRLHCSRETHFDSAIERAFSASWGLNNLKRILLQAQQCRKRGPSPSGILAVGDSI